MARRTPKRFAESNQSGSVFRNPFEPQRIFSEDRVEAIYLVALEVLETLRIKILLREAVEVFSQNGAKVVEDMVCLDADMV
jgi:trimethylamine:corrinoid methyltransferase-like protein